jgi:hypothetical protein
MEAGKWPIDECLLKALDGQTVLTQALIHSKLAVFFPLPWPLHLIQNQNSEADWTDERKNEMILYKAGGKGRMGNAPNQRGRWDQGGYWRKGMNWIGKDEEEICSDEIYGN